MYKERMDLIEKSIKKLNEIVSHLQWQLDDMKERPIEKKRSWEWNIKHGMSGTKIYKVCQYMIKACYDKENHAYSKYWKIWIKTAKQWIDFIWFYGDMSEEYKEWMKIKLKHWELLFNKENCTWQ